MDMTKSDTFVKTAKARKGRSNQVYSKESGARIVAGCIPLDESRTKIIMISSSKHKNRWILPKGGVENDEVENFAITAKRETWEEAGVTGIITKKLKVVQDHRFTKHKELTKIDLKIDGDLIPRTEFHFYEMEVDELSTVWPESNRRQRKWCSYSEAKHELIKSKRFELVDALNESSIVKDSHNIELTDEGHVIDTKVDEDNY
ncbi:unnamed protein product [[Candida] boidinii]|nr:unnamed protein product [[Candida] boidinii]